MAKISVRLRQFQITILALSGALMLSGTAVATSPGTSHNSGHINSGANSKTISNYRWHYNNGVKYFENGDIFKAKQIFSDLMRAGNNRYDPGLNYYMARIKSMQGDNKGALRHYRIVLNQAPGSFAIIAGIGESYAKLGKTDKALKVLTRLEAASGKCADICVNANIIDKSIEVVEAALAKKL